MYDSGGNRSNSEEYVIVMLLSRNTWPTRKQSNIDRVEQKNGIVNRIKSVISANTAIEKRKSDRPKQKGTQNTLKNTEERNYNSYSYDKYVSF